MNRMTFTPQPAPWSALLALALAAATCAAPALAGAPPDSGAPAATSPAASEAAPQAVPAARPPLVLDPTDLGFGATVVFTRIPTMAEFHDLQYLEGVRHVVLQLPAWPAGVDELQPLTQASLPQDADLLVILPGYPGSRAQAAAWNLLHQPVRIVMVVSGPPEDREMVYLLNSIRGLERVVADLDRPSRTGFERLQRPLSVRVVMP